MTDKEGGGLTPAALLELVEEDASAFNLDGLREAIKRGDHVEARLQAESLATIATGLARSLTFVAGTLEGRD